MSKHTKHGTIVKPSLGQYGRNEWAIIGAPCDVIEQLAGSISERLSPKWQCALVDADHQTHSTRVSAADADRELKAATDADIYQLRTWLNGYDALLINGNHFIANHQIVIIDERKKDSLQRKLDRLTDVQLILLQDNVSDPWPFLIEHLQGKEVPVLPLSDVGAIAAWMDDALTQAVPLLRGLVLAGGKSVRMGVDKGLMEYHGKPQREYTADLLARHCTEVFISCRPDQIAEISAPYQALPDTFLDLGPYSAMLSAFRAFPDSAWLVVACDLPLLDEGTLQFLAQHRDPSRIATAFNSPDNEFPEPLIAIWEPKAYQVLLQYLAQGYSCPRKVLINSDTALLQAPDAGALTNVNTPEESAEVRKHF
jgi:molybdopterin-guanine dinucleotide biosynthesis protein A